MKKLLLVLLVVFLVIPAWAQSPEPKSDKPSEPASTDAGDEDKILYSIGMLLARQVIPLGLDSRQVESMVEGLRDGALKNEPKVDAQAYAEKVQTFVTEQIKVAQAKEKDLSAAYVVETAKRPGAVQTDSGLVYEELEVGEGDMPTMEDRVRVHYHGTLRDGTVFDSSLGGAPAEFSMSGVVRCFSEGLKRMKAGGKARITCPSDIAYGERGSPPKILPGAALTFDLELVAVIASGS
ncbi:MAG: FKBP-type peptidyl-prolyl cis-trans isomerase [Acidobacteriota bacterium]|nr:FKBP-type peptidyl-prolyl cis-trans isomerase [Acidobacteriota bacterium]MDH3784711.1 FKBP-type peptidyl-prolyl cis-trans isomerase [Acidobacteriota bacterium]